MWFFRLFFFYHPDYTTCGREATAKIGGLLCCGFGLEKWGRNGDNTAVKGERQNDAE
jgi:hypothetical protein